MTRTRVRRKPRRGKGRSRKHQRRRRLGRGLKALGILLLLLVAGLFWLDRDIVSRFESRHAAFPSRVYSQPVEWFPGSPLTVEDAVRTLQGLGYRRRDTDSPGNFVVSGSALRVVTRGFVFESGEQPSVDATVTFGNGVIDRISRTPDADRLALLRLDPLMIGSIEAAQFEDRKIVRLHEVPREFLQTLLLVEDRNFDTHPGFDPMAIVRALVVNIRSGQVSQGGSTITQQLVKNLYLDSERTLTRKLKEVVYAVLLERRYGKDRILEAYINEVFLAQAGNRAIHGFGLGSQHFFGRPLSELEIQDFALLVGMVKAPTAYNPRRNPRRARERRGVVLDLLAREGVLNPDQARRMKQSPLGVTSTGARSGRPHAAFLDLVRRQLSVAGRGQRSSAEPLAVWSTLEPEVQRRAEASLRTGLERLEQRRGIEQGALQGAVVVLRAESAQVVALVGDRRPGFAGFNRALDARRPVGSLLKPVVALTALESGRGLHLASMLDDGPLRVDLPNGRRWQPGNYDNEHHGLVILADAIEQSYNVSTARLGLEVGVDRFAKRVRELSRLDDVPAYPSSLLGSVEMSPMEVARLYSVFSSGGLSLTARAFTSAVDSEGKTRVRFPGDSVRVIDTRRHYLVHHLLSGVVARGTASGVLGDFGRRAGLAGKTGTTDGFRDSWFAGYSGNYLVVVWVGRDDNGSTGLSGATGALTIFRSLMEALSPRAPGFEVPSAVDLLRIDPRSGGVVKGSCAGSRKIPFVEAEQPGRTRCGAAPGEVLRPSSGVGGWLRNLLNSGGAPRPPEPSGRR